MQPESQMESKLQAYYESQANPGAHVTNLQSISGGWETEVYAFDLRTDNRTEPLVLRVYPAGESALLRAVNEFHVMKHLHTAGYPVPQVFRFERNESYLGGAFVIMERVQGRPLQSYLGQQPELMARFVQLLFDLHQVDWHPFVGGDSPWSTPAEAEATFGLDWLAGTIEQYGFAPVFAPILSWLTDRSLHIAQSRTVIHGDYHPLNILMSEDGTAAVIDWGSTAIADPRLDLANAMIMAYVLGQPHLLPSILAGYETASGRNLADLDYFQALILTRRLSMMVIAMVHGDEACGMRPGTQVHLRQKLDVAQTIEMFLLQLTGVSLPGLEQVLAQFA